MKFNSKLIDFKISSKNREKIKKFIEEKYGKDLGAISSNFGKTRKFRWIKRILLLSIIIFIIIFAVQLFVFPTMESRYSYGLFLIQKLYPKL